MEESRDLIVGYKIFRSLVYISLLLEFFLYALDPGALDFWGGILTEIHGRMKRWFIYNDGNLIWSKVATLLLICITSIGTRNKKQLSSMPGRWSSIRWCRAFSSWSCPSGFSDVRWDRTSIR